MGYRHIRGGIFQGLHRQVVFRLFKHLFVAAGFGGNIHQAFAHKVCLRIFQGRNKGGPVFGNIFYLEVLRRMATLQGHKPGFERGGCHVRMLGIAITFHFHLILRKVAQAREGIGRLGCGGRVGIDFSGHRSPDNFIFFGIAFPRKGGTAGGGFGTFQVGEREAGFYFVVEFYIIHLKNQLLGSFGSQGGGRCGRIGIVERHTGSAFQARQGQFKRLVFHGIGVQIEAHQGIFHRKLAVLRHQYIELARLIGAGGQLAFYPNIFHLGRAVAIQNGGAVVVLDRILSLLCATRFESEFERNIQIVFFYIDIGQEHPRIGGHFTHRR